MNLEKLFGSKTKVDILKYLLYRRQGVSMRALEGEMEWTFPAIKKQVDSLKSANVLNVNTDGSGWSITIKPELYDMLKKIFHYSLRSELVDLFDSYGDSINRYFFGKCFGIELDMDLVIIYKDLTTESLNEMREKIGDIFKGYFIEVVNVVFMSLDEWEKRYRFADRFALDIMRTKQF